MHSPDLQPTAVEHRLEALHAQLHALAQRVQQLEQRGTAPTPWSPSPSQTPSPSHTYVGGMHPGALGPAASMAHDGELETSASNPGRVLALTGGVALLLGLIGFVAYAIEQDWLPPMLRFVGAALIAALLTVAAWPLAKRGHAAVAGSVGGAGLGAWFASWLFARHAHELVSGPLLTTALVLGAAACLLIADRLRLRSMAVLASLAACATPMLVASGGERLAELMIYQLAVVGVLALIDARRRWPELPSIALGSTWLLGARWASVHLQPDNAWAFMLWAGLILLAAIGSAWRLHGDELEPEEREHTIARLLVAGIVTWAAAIAAFMHAPATLGVLSLGLAAWQLIAARSLERPVIAHGSRRFVALAWVELFVAGPLLLHGGALAWWWIGMSVIAAAVPWSPIARMRRVLLLMPAVAAVSWSLALPSASLGLPVALVAASVPIASAMLRRWPLHDDTDGRPDAILTIATVLLWSVSVCVAGPTALAARLVACLPPLLLVIGFACARPQRSAINLSLAAIVLALVELGGTIIEGHALQSHGSPKLAFALAGIALALAGSCYALLRRAAHARALEQLVGDDEHAPLGSLIAVALGTGACLLAAALVRDATLVQVAFTACIALTGLGSLIAGLRARQGRWRELGLAAIATAGAKLVLFDLAGVAPVWRAVAFLGIGAVLIAGAMAYSRAQQRARATA